MQEPMSVMIRYDDVTDAGAVAGMALALTEEISARTGARQFDLSLADTTALAARLMSEGHLAVVLAVEGEQPVGFVSISFGYALYAGGALATIQEFFVIPRLRSRAIGAMLVARAEQVARERGCLKVEVCTPPLPAFDATLAFYQRHGFVVAGGRKLRKLVG